MFSIILRFTFRNLRKNNLYHFISIGGLTIAMASAFFILVWINHELSYDNFHPNADRLYRITFEYNSREHQSHFARSAQEWVLQIPGYFPEVEQMIRLQPLRTATIKIEENKLYSSRSFCADSSFFNVFGFNLIKGNPDKVLSEPRSLVLSQSLVSKYFGGEDPVGKTLYLGHQFDTVPNLYTITGVMEDFPVNSHFHIDVLGSFDNPEQHIGWAYIYILLRKGSDPEDILKKFPEFLKQFTAEDQVQNWEAHLQPIRDIHLYSDKDREIENNGKAQNIYIFSVVALLLLIIALINYANIQLAAINKKLSFIFLNRVVGARIRDVLKFIFVESLIQHIIVIILSVGLLIAGVPAFNRFFGYHLNLNNLFIWLQIVGLGLFIAILGIAIGVYPVFMLRIKEKLYSLGGRIFYESGFSLIHSTRKVTGRKLMIVMQFVGSTILILATLLVYLQVNYMLENNIGSGQDDVLVLKNLPRPVLDNFMLFKEKLLSIPLIKEVSASMEEPGHEVLDAMNFEMEGMDESLSSEFLSVLPVDKDFLDFYNIPLLAGDNFPDYRGMEVSESYIINESALKKLDFKSPEDALGRQFKLKFQWPEIFKGGQIIGVSKDFHFYTMRKAVKPMVMFQKHIWFWCFVIRVDDKKFKDAVNYLNKTWDEIFPDYPLEYYFVDDLYASTYQTEILQAKVVGIFALLTFLIACLDLIGITTYTTEVRTKEIGIRKVNGAGIFDIVFLLNKEIIAWVIMAFIIASPIAWIFVNKWLQNFVYRIDISWKIFAGAGVLVLLLAMLSTIFQTYRAASMDPVKSLRYE